MNRISYVANGQKLGDRDRFFEHLDTLRPAWTGIMDDAGVAATVAAIDPDMKVFHRNFPDGGGLVTPGHRNYLTPDLWFQRYGNIQEGISLHTTNEPLTGRGALEYAARVKQVIDWHKEAMAIAVKVGRPLVIGNFGVSKLRQPDKDGSKNGWEDFHELIELCNQNRELFVMGIHEYAGAVITSGFIGGNPTLIQPDSWPTDFSTPAIGQMIKWHCGRYAFLEQYCKRARIRVPRLLVTEHGFDDLSDIDPFLKSLIKTPPYDNIRGWKTLENQWRDWWPQWSAEEAYAEQMIYADLIYPASAVEGRMIFTWADDPESIWHQFDVSRAFDFQRILEQGVVTPPLPEPPLPEPEPPPPPETSDLIEYLEMQQAYLKAQSLLSISFIQQLQNFMERLKGEGQ